jgi:pimeloyl-ACP methyl ester carboxylesterase
LITQKSLYIDDDNHKIHLRFIAPTFESHKLPVMMVHGAIEDGRIFYTPSGKGLACELARAGHPAYVVDLRGRGQSLPGIKDDPEHGQFESITETLPTIHRYIVKQHQRRVHWIAHSWGGVLMASTLTRFPSMSGQVASQVFFGSKRCIRTWSIERLVKVELFWKLLAVAIARIKGYLPAKEMRLGSDNETYLSLKESVAWVKNSPWLDIRDGFNYQQQAKSVTWPVSWFIAAANDFALGNPSDVKDFATELGLSNITILSRKNGNLVDYDHINMLVHPLARDDHFPQLIDFMFQAEL